MSEWFDSENNIIVDTLPELMSAANTRQFGETKAETLTRFLMCEAFERRYVPEEALAFRLAAMIISRIETQPAAQAAEPADTGVLTAAQESLGVEFEKVLHDNLFDLYEESPHTARLESAQADSVLEDAERYRFLRDGEWRNTELEPFIRLQLNALWDSKIDTAIAAQQGTS